MDMIIERMVDYGFSTSDLRNLEWLSDSEILASMGVQFLNRNLKADTIAYLTAWANLLENKLLHTNRNFQRTTLKSEILFS